MITNASKELPIIAILGGTGKEGPGLAMRWAKVGYHVIIGSRQAEKAQMTANSLNEILGLDTVTGMDNGSAAREADICVLTVVQSAHQSALEGLVDDLQGKILVDATARVEFQNPKPPMPPSAAQSAQKLLGDNVRVVAAFQNVPAHELRHKLGDNLNTDVLVCSDNTDAAMAVIDLARAGGMRAYFAGGLVNAIVVEGLTAILISMNKYYKIRSAAIAISGLNPDPE